MAEEGICPCWNLDNVTDNLHGRMIYKDECCRCFAEPTDPTGLDVCMRCFLGSCRPNGPDDENHSLIHFKNTDHPIVLNIKKVEKETSNEPVKITKLAIGKPGGIDPEADKYDEVVSVYCHKCNKNLDHTHPKIEPMVKSI